MFNRLVLVVMLMLFPLQWSAAQGHELNDDAGAFSVAFDTGAEISQLLVHTDEPGGVCQFHELSQPSAALASHDAGNLLARAAESWVPGRHQPPPGLHSPSDIEKPKWGSRHLLAANS